MWLLATVTAFALQAQTPAADIQRLFDGGRHQQVVQAAADSTDPRAVYLAGLSLVALDRTNDARHQFDRLSARPDRDVWHHIGTSAALLNRPGAQDDAVLTAQAEAAARAAVALDETSPSAHYQLGLVQGRKRAYSDAAAAFEAAIARAPTFAYAHYYAGLSHYQVGRTDKMAIAFEAFLKLAPEAPERARVESIMRTLRGRR